MFGHVRSELIGQPIERLVPAGFRAEQADRLADFLVDTPTRRVSAGRDVYGVRKDGTEFPLEIGLHPLQTPTGRFVLSSIVDITQRKRSERELSGTANIEELMRARLVELEGAMAVAEQANRAKSTFLAKMSHELRTPMHAVLAFARLGLDTDPDSEMSAILGNIVESGNRLLVLLNGLLDLSKLEAGKTTLVLALHDLESIAREIALQMTPLIAKKHLTVRFERAVGCESCVANVDRHLIAQLFSNLFANAVRFSADAGNVVVRFARGELPVDPAENEARPRAALEVAFIDEGIGIPEPELDSVFDMFSQSSRTRHDSAGPGLGLAICREITTLHQGTIRASTNEARGVTILVTIPLQMRPASKAGDEA
jgi:PAS domain S-box-containing protein